MENLGDRVRKLREEKNMTQTELAELLGMKTYTTVTKWEKNDNFPKGKDLKKLAELFNVTSDYLLGLTNDKHGKNGSEKQFNNSPTEITTIYNKLHTPRQTKVLTFAKNQLDEQEDENSNIIPLFKYNHFDSAISAGTGQYLSDVRVEEIELPVDYDADFVVPVYGDSMEPKYHNQDYVFIKLSVDLTDGSIGVFDLNGDAYIKELRITDKGAYLHSLNPNYKDIQITEDDSFRVIGKVVGRYNENDNK